MNANADLSHVTTDLLADAFESLAEGIAVYDAQERLIFCNDRYRRTLHPVADMIRPGMSWRDLVRASDAGTVRTFGGDREAILRGEFDGRMPRSHFQQVGTADYEVTYRPTRAGGFVVTRTDITERRAAERLAADRAALLTKILETNPIPVVMARASDSRTIYISPSAREILGDIEYAGDTYAVPGQRAEYLAALQRDGRVEDFRALGITRDGTVRSFALSGVLTEYQGETCVVSSITDLTEIIDREALIRKVVEACPAPVLMAHAWTGEIIFRSPEVDALFGAQESVTAFYGDPSERAGFLDLLRERGVVRDHRLRFRRGDGTAFWGAVSARLITWDGAQAIVSHTRDLTGQLALETELDRQRGQMFLNEKMTALSGLMAGVAHELNNPLSVVVGHALMLEDEIADAGSLKSLRKISEAAERCTRVVKGFLSLARQEPARIERTDIAEVLEITVEVARYGDALGGARIELTAEPGLHVGGDGDQLVQAILNLVLNAAQAIREAGRDGTITIATRASGSDAVVTVEDDGPGIAEDVRARIFEPLFTTRGLGQGAGMGLAMSHRIVTAHGGAIAVERAPSGGGRMVVTLPLWESGTQDTGAAAETTAPEGRRVLIIDDEPDVADLNAEILVRSGYDVEAVSNSREALERLRDGRFDAVVSDLNMPDVDGRGIHDFIQSERPDLVRGLGFLSGDTMGRKSLAFLSEMNRPYAEKPLSPRELRAFVARLVGTDAS